MSYTIKDVIYSLIRLYPGKNRDIFALAEKAKSEGESLGLKDKDLVDYVDNYIREELD